MAAKAVHSTNLSSCRTVHRQASIPSSPGPHTNGWTGSVPKQETKSSVRRVKTPPSPRDPITTTNPTAWIPLPGCGTGGKPTACTYRDHFRAEGFEYDHVFDWTEKLLTGAQSEVDATVPLAQRSQRAPKARMPEKGLRWRGQAAPNPQMSRRDVRQGGRGNATTAAQLRSSRRSLQVPHSVSQREGKDEAQKGCGVLAGG